MENEGIKTIKLEKHETRDIQDKHVNGSLTVIWRDWDDKLSISPKMIYVTTANPWEIKGPHLHTKRDSYFVCVQGKVVFVIQNHDGKYHEIECDEEEPVMVHVPKNYASAHMNITNEKASILTITNLAWRPNDNEMQNVTFDDYDWSKWKKNITN